MSLFDENKCMKRKRPFSSQPSSDIFVKPVLNLTKLKTMFGFS